MNWLMNLVSKKDNRKDRLRRISFGYGMVNSKSNSIYGESRMTFKNKNKDVLKVML